MTLRPSAAHTWRMELETIRARVFALREQGRAAEALATLAAGADAAVAMDPKAAARLLVDAVDDALYVAGPDRAVSIAERAVQLASGPAGVELQRSLVRLGDALSWAGRYDDARQAWLRAAIGSDESDPEILAERADALLRLGDPAAHDAAFRAVVAAREIGARALIADALNLATVAEVRAGRLLEALGTAEATLEAAGPDTMDGAQALGLIAWVLALLGDETRCREVMRQAGQAIEERRVTVIGGLAHGLLALSLGSPAEAVAAFETRLRSSRWGPVAAMTGLRPFAAELVEAYARAGELEKGRRALAATLPVALGSDQPRLIAPMRRAQGILEDDVDAFQHAFDAHAGWANRFEEARTRLAFGELLRRRKHRAEARAELKTAIALFDQVRSRLWLERALAEQRLAGERLPARRPLPAAAPEALTRQEGVVLELVRAGLSNREIAERLVLSIKTVEGHLTTIYGKLGVASRAKALAALARSEAE